MSVADALGRNSGNQRFPRIKSKKSNTIATNPRADLPRPKRSEQENRKSAAFAPNSLCLSPTTCEFSCACPRLLVDFQQRYVSVADALGRNSENQRSPRVRPEKSSTIATNPGANPPRPKRSEQENQKSAAFAPNSLCLSPTTSRIHTEQFVPVPDYSACVPAGGVHICP